MRIPESEVVLGRSSGPACDDASGSHPEGQACQQRSMLTPGDAWVLGDTGTFSDVADNAGARPRCGAIDLNPRTAAESVIALRTPLHDSGDLAWEWADPRNNAAANVAPVACPIGQ